ncbi:hypothetical protein AM452_02720 [Enterobacter cloacae]|nr:hypothetical protein AM452_02720 [Enterobacter cloacae]
MTKSTVAVGLCFEHGGQILMRKMTLLLWGRKMKVILPMKKRRAIVGDMKVFALKGSSGGRSGLNIQALVNEYVEMKILTCQILLLKLMELGSLHLI